MFWTALTATDISIGNHYESGYKEKGKHSSCSLTDIIHLVYNKKKVSIDVREDFLIRGVAKHGNKLPRKKEAEIYTAVGFQGQSR